MPKLVWDKLEARRFETGVSNGVFYPIGGLGVVWNGLTSVGVDFGGGSTTPHYVDGVKYLASIESRNVEATINAFSAPIEFAEHEGDKNFVPGFHLTKQPKKRFNFTWQTKFGDGYKIHMLYNALATQTSRAHSTTGASATPQDLEWKISATPVRPPYLRPTSYFAVEAPFVVPSALSALENKLYGTVSTDPSFPTIAELVALFGG